jgi:hypothetical protein
MCFYAGIKTGIRLVLYNLENIAGSGFYACDSSNTITTPMPAENVQAMVDTVRKFGKYPISIK